MRPCVFLCATTAIAMPAFKKPLRIVPPAGIKKKIGIQVAVSVPFL
jgi:hypothetical protein